MWGKVKGKGRGRTDSVVIDDALGFGLCGGHAGGVRCGGAEQAEEGGYDGQLYEEVLESSIQESLGRWRGVVDVYIVIIEAAVEGRDNSVTNSVDCDDVTRRG